MATVPISGTSIRLMSGVPFYNDYKDTRWFDNRTQQDSYFNSRTTVHNMGGQNSFQRIEGRHFVKVNKSIDDLWGTNYLTFLNRNKRFYAFVTTMEYINDGLTHVYFEIDVLQTWLFEMNFKPSYVVREHRKLWNNDGTPVINTIDEGLNYGLEYDVVESIQVTPHPFKWLVIASKQPIATGDEYKASTVGIPQPLTYYVVPFFDDDTTPNLVLEKNNLGYTILEPSKVLKALYEIETAVNNIVSIYVTDFIGVNVWYDSDSKTITIPDTNQFVFDVVRPKSDIDSIMEVQQITRFSALTKEVSTNKYKLNNVDVSNVKESKLLMYPYTVLVLDDFKGNRQEFKLEYIESKQLLLRWKGSVGISNFNTIAPSNYNKEQNSNLSLQTSNEDALISDQPNDVPILADMLSAYLQGEKNSIKNRQSQLQFNSMANLMGQGASTIASTATGNYLGTFAGLTNMVQGAGNTVYELQGINAKMKDINNIPPQLQKQGSNTNYNYGNRYNGVFAMIKQIKPEYKKILEDFFHMFGYKTNELKIPNFHTRQHFNYIETKSCTITGNFNNNDLQKLKNVFNNGITLWHTNDIGNYNLSNGVI